MSRWRWSLLPLTGLVLISLSLLGAYFVQGPVKGQCFILLIFDSVSDKNNIINTNLISVCSRLYVEMVKRRWFKRYLKKLSAALYLKVIVMWTCSVNIVDIDSRLAELHAWIRNRGKHLMILVSDSYNAGLTERKHLLIVLFFQVQ